MADADAGERPDQLLAKELVERVGSDGRSLVGPGGLLTDLTRRVLQSGLDVEMEEHLGDAKHVAEGPNGGSSRNG